MAYAFPTLPDLLRPGLDLVFVGINPSIYAVERGHYFARRSNRFWPAFSRSCLSLAARQELGLEALGPEHDRDLPRYGIGFTDVVKIPTRNAGQLDPAVFKEWTPRLIERLAWAAPRVACFHGVTGYRPFARHGLGTQPGTIELGAQPEALGHTLLYVVPNPSGANAHVTLVEQTAWYDRLADFLGSTP